MELRIKALSALIWSAIQAWGTRVVSFFVLLILARLLVPESFGLVATASVVLDFIQVFVNQGFGEAIVQRAELEPEHLDAAFWLSILMGIVLTAIGVISAGLVAAIFSEPRLVPIVRWLSFNFVFVALSGVQQALLRRRLAFKALAARSFVANVIGGVVGVAMAFLGYGVWCLVAQTLVRGLVGVIALWGISDWRPRLAFSRRHFRELFGFSVNILGMNVLTFFNRRTDDFLIGYFLGPVALGYYIVAYRVLLVMINLVIDVITSVTLPVFSRMQGDPERLRRAFYEAVHYIELAAFPIFLAVFVMAPELVSVLYGPQWVSSIPVMQVLSLVGVLLAAFYIHGNLLVAAGRPGVKLCLMLMHTVCNVIAFTVAVRWGIVAVATAFVVRGYLLAPVEVWVIRRLTKIDLKIYLRQYVAPLVGSVVMVLVVVGLKQVLAVHLGLYLQVVIYGLAGFLAYLLAVFVMAPVTLRRLLESIRSVWMCRRVTQP
ncbi:MAG: lipopolysaccharide biosynthesis protein [Anaerolineae bacterium]|nr:lipopolysaccharide biosynthesis protein [Anaerolineae bacterium]